MRDMVYEAERIVSDAFPRIASRMGRLLMKVAPEEAALRADHDAACRRNLWKAKGRRRRETSASGAEASSSCCLKEAGCGPRRCKGSSKSVPIRTEGSKIIYLT
jgi:hypothetical protein